MVARVRVTTQRPAAGDYFPAAIEHFIRSGCTLLDCAATGGGKRSLAGAWPMGRIVNIVGDKSVGKTLLAIEACANFARAYPRGRIRYRESESAFTPDFAVSMGLPLARVDFGPQGIKTKWNTVEDIFEDLRAAIAKDKRDGVPSLYIVDSLDALSSRSRMGRDLDKGTYGTDKAKVLSELFQELAREFGDVNMCLIFISQIRDKIGTSFGVSYTRSGGNALNFYTTHIVYLSHLSTVYRTVNGIKRPVGVRIRAKFTKNKVSKPFQECEFVLKFEYGVDDLTASVVWLKSVGMLGLVGLKQTSDEAALTRFLTAKEKLPDSEYREYVEEVRSKVVDAWVEVEKGFKPRRRKYA